MSILVPPPSASLAPIDTSVFVNQLSAAGFWYTRIVSALLARTPPTRRDPVGTAKRLDKLAVAPPTTGMDSGRIAPTSSSCILRSFQMKKRPLWVSL